MDRLVIEGGRPLRGKIDINGSKNAVLPVLAASILTHGQSVIKKAPKLMDVVTLCDILRTLGVKNRRRNGSVELEVESESFNTASYEYVSKMRGSICVLGPLLAKRGKARVSLPGGCVIGTRPIDLHIKGLRALGAKIRIKGGYIEASARRLKGTEIYLGGNYGSTVLGTANVMMAATLAKGKTIIEHAACEPEVQDLADYLNKCGARITGIGSKRLIIEGVSELKGCSHEIIPDRIESGTFAVAAAIVPGSHVSLTSMRPDHMTALIDLMRTMGVTVRYGKNWMRISRNGTMKSANFSTFPYPGIPTDMQSQLMALLTLAEGTSIVTERVFPDPFRHVAELGRLGSNIQREGPHAIIRGVAHLTGAQVMASDLRAGAALVLAGLAAEGVTEVNRVYHIDRGYERIEERLSAAGADISRISD